MRHYIADLKDYVGQKVELRGWAFNLRSSGKIDFLVLRDGTGLSQCVDFKGEPSLGSADCRTYVRQSHSRAFMGAPTPDRWSKRWQ